MIVRSRIFKAWRKVREINAGAHLGMATGLPARKPYKSANRLPETSGECDALPRQALRIPDRQRSGLRPVVRRALNDNQMLLLNAIRSNSFESLSALLNYLSSARRIPLSTLKLNARILRNLGLVEIDARSRARLTEPGRTVLLILGAGRATRRD